MARQSPTSLARSLPLRDAIFGFRCSALAYGMTLSLSLHSTYILSILTHLLTPSLTNSIQPHPKVHKNDDHPPTLPSNDLQPTTSSPPTSPPHTSNVPTQAFPPFPFLLFFLTFFRLLLLLLQRGSSTEEGLHSGFEYVTCSQ